MDTNDLKDRFHRVLVDEIRTRRPEFLRAPFTVAEIYQDLVPYRTHRDRIGVEMNGDYEQLLLSLLAGEEDYLFVESEVARQNLRSELRSSNPNPGIVREYAAAEVRLNPDRLGAAPRPEAGTGTAPAGMRPEDHTVPVESLAPSAGDDVEDGHPDIAEILPAPASEEPAPAPVTNEAPADEVPTCRWCREELPRRNDLRFCPFCGTDVNVVPCPECGEELEPQWRFCIACGTDVSSD